VTRGGSDLLSVAPVTSALLGINIALFVYCVMASNSLELNHDVLLALGMSQRELLWEDQWFRLIMPNFLHGGVLHIIFNSYALYLYGPMTERHFGSSNFGTLYLLSGVGGFACSQMCGGYFAVGASASIMGIMGAIFSVEVLAYPVLKNAWKSSSVRNVAFWIGLNFALGLVAFRNIDNWAHLGGLIYGIALGAFFEVWRKQRRFGLLLIAGMVLPIAISVAAARWTIFSPYYHIHKAVIATEEAHNTTLANEEFEQARKWARFWHKDRTVEAVIQTYRNKQWDLNTARVNTYYLIEKSIRWQSAQSF
jgi:membrane associated rhomboid family serine protease